MSGAARRGTAAAGFAVLAAVWLGPLPALAESTFTAHMAIHVSVVAIAAPLLAVGLAGTRADPLRLLRAPLRGAPGAPDAFDPLRWAAVPASIFELAVVWLWHSPALHHAARGSAGAFVLEQGSFLVAGLAVWSTALAGRGSERRRERDAAGVVGLLLTSMHMTLLGALLGLSSRPLYHGSLDDQHLGGALMLIAGSLPYLAGGLVLAGSLLRDAADAPSERAAGRFVG